MLLRSHAPAARKQQSLMTHVVSYGRLSLALVLSGGLLWASMKEISLSQGLRSYLAEVALDLRSVIHNLFHGMRISVGHTVESLGFEPQVKSDPAHIEALRIRLAELEQENRALRASTNTLPATPLSYKTVPVVDVRLNAAGMSVWLGAGENAGLRAGDVVVSGQQLIGRIIDVTSSYSRVLLIQDPQSHVPVVGAQSGVHSIASGQDQEPLKVSILEGGTSLEAGEPLLTSGRGGLFPKGLMLGRVKSVEGALGSGVASLNLAQLDYVQVIKGLDPLPVDEE